MADLPRWERGSIVFRGRRRQALRNDRGQVYVNRGLYSPHPGTRPVSAKIAATWQDNPKRERP